MNTRNIINEKRESRVALVSREYRSIYNLFKDAVINVRDNAHKKFPDGRKLPLSAANRLKYSVIKSFLFSFII